MGPTLWTCFYKHVLTSITEENVRLVAFADDLAVIVCGKNPEALEENASYTLSRVSQTLEDMGLTLAKHKTEATVLRGWRKCKNLNIKIDDTAVVLLQSLKYIGVQINNDWNFHQHVNGITTKASTIIRKLGQITPRIGVPRAVKRRMIAAAVHSMLYASPNWEKALKRGTKITSNVSTGVWL